MTSRNQGLNRKSHIRGLFVAFLFFVFLVNTLYCLAEDAKWVWIFVEIGQNEYETFEGKAEVIIKDGKFEAKLFDKVDSYLRFTLTGEIKGNKVMATVITHESDIGAVPVLGQYRKKFKKELALKTQEVFVLTNEYDLISISRAY